MIRNNVVIFGNNYISSSGYIPSLAISDTSFGLVDVDGEKNAFTVTVADVTQTWDYEISTGDDSWISVHGASKIGTDSMSIWILAQPAGEQPPRGGTITFTSDDCANKVLTISQAARAG
jgi:hypothetical protein